MKHLNPEEALVAGLLRSTRTVAVIGASPRHGRHSGDVVSYLHKAGYDVVPVRPDRASVGGLPTYAHLDDVAGRVNLVVIFRRAAAVIDHIRQAVARRADAVWLPPGTWSHEAGQEAKAHDLLLVKDRCIIEAHRHLFGAMGDHLAGHPTKYGVHFGHRGRSPEEPPLTARDSGYKAGGGGGSRAGGGVRGALDEKKMNRRRR